ncbi:para-hydroxybenzoate--polyprenyltransferase [Plasmodium gonderi]|uniref:Para-hydroxybenzoate--polyprenyltransferase n=1 Tax=Plasmodium gonderi TaxID=77519 RepID=A0A1Y1JHE6_PLAGO|nr:para-hydroxybenzoate--polyprenyltransferase [Plasmodium gonderi]GAW81946.1 para-hydroxybenzoate--polyprenyltransferase [Plasmodium gonderi]
MANMKGFLWKDTRVRGKVWYSQKKRALKCTQWFKTIIRMQKVQGGMCTNMRHAGDIRSNIISVQNGKSIFPLYAHKEIKVNEVSKSLHIGRVNLSSRTPSSDKMDTKKCAIRNIPLSNGRYMGICNGEKFIHIRNLERKIMKCYYSVNICDDKKESEKEEKKKMNNVNEHCNNNCENVWYSHWLSKSLRGKNTFFDVIKKNLIAYAYLSRLHIPTGMYLLFNSALYGYFLTFPVETLFTTSNDINWSSIYKIVKDIMLFTFGSVNSRIVGCIINDMFDKNYDRHVERTKNRPLANNTISMKRAFTYLVIHSVMSLLTLFQFNLQTIYIGLGSTFFIITYPLLKRITYYAQVYLSITFNLGFLISSSVNIDLLNNAVPLFVSFIPLCYFTIIYDTIYAHQDKHEDIKLNLKSLAIKWDKKTLKYSKFLTLNMTYLFYLSAYFFNMHYSYYIFSTCNILYLFFCLNKVSLNDKEKCMQFFKNSKNILLLIALSALAAKLCEAYKRNESLGDTTPMETPPKRL